MKILSPKLKIFLEFIQRFTLTYGQSPSYEEIMFKLGFKSLGTVNWYVNTLEKQGYLSRVKGHNGKRALTLIHKEYATITTSRLPLLGLIAAGEPIEALENPEMMDVPPFLLHPDNYVLRVKGDSMIDEQIHDGDFIVAKKTKIASSGQIVVALINGGSFYRLENSGTGPMIMMGNRSGSQKTIKIIDYETRKDVRQKYSDGKVHIHKDGVKVPSD